MADISKITNGGTTYDVKDGVTRDTVTNAVTNHGIGTVYREQILAPVTIAPEDWQENGSFGLTYTLTGYDLNLAGGHIYIVTIGETEYRAEAWEYEGTSCIEVYDNENDRVFDVTVPPAPDAPSISTPTDAPFVDAITFSIVEKTINGIDKIFQWDAVFFLDIENDAGQVIKGSQAEVFAKLTSDLPVVSVLAIAKIADNGVPYGVRYVQCGVDMYPYLSTQDVYFRFWTGTQGEEFYWVWYAGGFLQAD